MMTFELLAKAHLRADAFECLLLLRAQQIDSSGQGY